SLREAFESVLAQMAAEAEAADTADTSLSAEAPAQTNFIDRFTADPIANSAALVVLAGLIVSFGAVLFLSRSRLARFTQIMQILGGVAGLVFSALLLLGSEGDLLVLALAGAEAAIFAFLLWQVGRLQLDGHRPTWLLPLVAVAGLGVAAYLSYVELTLSDAVCGAVGDCNAVQQSAYAQIFGIPIGVIGMIGYAVILLVWLYGRWSQDTRANDLILALALVGSVFSAYLTFLEPFFIGATCMWCLTSAVIMLLILWLAAPEQVEKQPLRPAHA
ncbi:MAG: vitamin K epoxide reductase family protein, partial [Anaerolineae bacterium]|nr:vitamin K epoxide reductase family protein [Anaerolineae bacterium]